MVDLNKIHQLIPQPESNQADSELSLFDRENPDISLFNLVDDELIKLSGSKLLYFKYIQTKEYDDVYMEQKIKPILTSPIIVYAHYDPKVVEENLQQFGLEITNDQIFTFNKSSIESKIGRAPIAGDVITSMFQNIRYEIFEVQEDSFAAYGVYHYVCTAKVQRDGPEAQNSPLTKVADTVGGENV